MKTVLLATYIKRIIEFVAIVFLLSLTTRSANAQCIAGSNQANVNWDNLDYLVTSGSYSGYVTNAMSRIQAFTIGVNRVVITYPATITAAGENTTHTGETQSFSTGADVQYTGNGNITFTFDEVVNNFSFSLYDIDNSQRVNVTAVNALAVALPVTMTRPTTGNITITGSGSTNAQGQAPGTGQATTSNVATLNVTVTGPVKTVTVAVSGTAGDFWLSDLGACVTGTFPNNYFVGSRPFTGQPTYIIGTSDTNTVSLINTATGQAKMIFQDVTSPRYINGIGYDHLEHNLYYVIDFTTNPAINKTIKRYNFDTEVMSVVVSDVNTLGIPVFNRGVESAGCAFYDNDLYFGIEGNIPGNNGGRETIIWRIEFDVPGGNAIKASQVYACPADNGSGTVMHDWNDFTVADGLLVDFAGAPTTAQRRFTHYDLQTQTIVNNYFTGGLTPRQAGITWDNTRYWVYNTVAVYNMNGTIGPQTTITGATPLDWTGFCGDATGFRPKSDFGDAPASYDPDPLSPALHEKDTALRLGPTWDQEFNKISSLNANADGSDEDAIGTVQILDTATTTFLSSITVYNNTGSNATLAGWLDINGNGTFEPGEGRSITVPHGGPVLQTVTLSWVAINTPLTTGQSTYLRIRVTRASSGMTVNQATGYYNNGEVEDYRVFVFGVLPVHLLSFEAKAVSGKAVIEWDTENESQLSHYELYRSTDAQTWQKIYNVAARNVEGQQQYIYSDQPGPSGKFYYRLKIVSQQGNDEKLSDIQSVSFTEIPDLHVLIAPNPVRGQLMMQVTGKKNEPIQVWVTNAAGERVWHSTHSLNQGTNVIKINASSNWPDGFYLVRLQTGEAIVSKSFIRLR